MTIVAQTLDNDNIAKQTKATDSVQVHILYFASLAEAVGQHEEVVSIAPDSTATALYALIQDKHQLTESRHKLRVAVNDDFASWSTVIHDGDWVAFIPPVAGG